MIKRILSIFLVVSVLSTILVGCGKNQSGTETTNTTTEAEIPETTLSYKEILESVVNIDELTYSQYNAMSTNEQIVVMNSFESTEEFVQWYDNAKKEEKEFEEFLNSGKTDPTTESTDDPTGETTDETAPEASEPAIVDTVTFLEYQAMSGNEQKRFMMSFSSIDAFMKWHAKAVQEYKDSMTEFDATPTETTAS